MRLEKSTLFLSPEEYNKLKAEIINGKMTINVEITDEFNKKDIDNKMEEIEDWFLTTYRLLFKGKKTGSMGDRNGGLFKMALFLVAYPEYTQEDIIQATTKYLETFVTSFTAYKYLKQADYFIFKQEEIDGKKMLTSKLLSILEDTTNEVVEMSNDYFKTL